MAQQQTTIYIRKKKKEKKRLTNIKQKSKIKTVQGTLHPDKLNHTKGVNKMRVRLLKWILKVSGIEKTLNNLIAENNNLKKRLREVEGLNNYNRRF